MEGHSIIENVTYKCKRRDSKYSKDKRNDRTPIYSKEKDSETQRSTGYVWSSQEKNQIWQTKDKTMKLSLFVE